MTTHARERVVALFARHYGAPPAEITDVAPDGSSRRYFRMPTSDGQTVIGGYGSDRRENRAFLSFSSALRAAGLPVPEILADNRRQGVWLEEDLGDSTLFDLLSAARTDPTDAFPDGLLALYSSVVRILPRFQVDGGQAVNFRVAYPRRAFDRQSMLWDLNYFKYHFLKLAHVPFDEARLERDFSKLVRFLLEADREHFMYRDFQSRNIMVRDGEPWFIDYQGGRRGALQYDVASLLYDAKADLPAAVRDELLHRYLEALEEVGGADPAGFMRHYLGFVLIRILQAMGAYGYRGFFERKPRFLESVPYAARNLSGLLREGLPISLPELEASLSKIVERWAGDEPQGSEESALRVDVTSFSYRIGYPEDRAGHGGGYVFDCRGITNPGRRAEFAHMTGLDDPVAEFLAAQSEATVFWDGVRHLTESHVDEYRRRSFSSLSIAFGCTGGQHRSVYFAERLARHLSDRYPELEVVVRHRERGSWPTS